MSNKPNIVVLTGAGISAESGIKTFRDADGLWEQYDVMEVASIGGWARNPSLVLEFYNQRRRQLLEVKPNQAHFSLSDLQNYADVTIITQNIDDLHERAGSNGVVHLHGELLSVRSEIDSNLVYRWTGDLKMGQCASDGAQLRPDIVWFGEMVPKIPEAEVLVANADFLMVIGTSLQVYPAAGLVAAASMATPIFYIDPNPGNFYALPNPKLLTLIRTPATSGVDIATKQILNNLNLI
ncbi:MAG: NAD-dependent deacylase [Saprospiraceae bacterium]|nr:NAD-dependent deacylase [Saprospiraceae bacterium]